MCSSIHRISLRVRQSRPEHARTTPRIALKAQRSELEALLLQSEKDADAITAIEALTEVLIPDSNMKSRSYGYQVYTRT
jgi:hypothetical protein